MFRKKSNVINFKNIENKLKHSKIKKSAWFFVKRIFCFHNYRTVAEVSGGWCGVCVKCGKVKFVFCHYYTLEAAEMGGDMGLSKVGKIVFKEKCHRILETEEKC